MCRINSKTTPGNIYRGKEARHSAVETPPPALTNKSCTEAGITKAGRIYSLETMEVFTRYHFNPSLRCGNSSV